MDAKRVLAAVLAGALIAPAGAPGAEANCPWAVVLEPDAERSDSESLVSRLTIELDAEGPKDAIVYGFMGAAPPGIEAVKSIDVLRRLPVRPLRLTNTSSGTWEARVALHRANGRPVSIYLLLAASRLQALEDDSGTAPGGSGSGPELKIRGGSPFVGPLELPPPTRPLPELDVALASVETLAVDTHLCRFEIALRH